MKRPVIASAIIVCIALASPAQARIHRSHAAKHHFMMAHPCPSGPDMGSTHKCRGFVVDHRIALACGGDDDPSNMQWQSVADGRAKDKWERIGCDR